MTVRKGKKTQRNEVEITIHAYFLTVRGNIVVKILFIYLFLERGREGEREGEKYQCVVAFHMPPTGDLPHNPGMCADRESNQQLIGLQASTQSTEPHQPGQ